MLIILRLNNAQVQRIHSESSQRSGLIGMINIMKEKVKTFTNDELSQEEVVASFTYFVKSQFNQKRLISCTMKYKRSVQNFDKTLKV